MVATFSALAIRGIAASSCEEVWFVEGSFLGDTFTCGDRIVYLQTPQGGGKTEQEARVQASLEELKCADCWPWEKYRQDGETERSPKRGIAIENHKLTAESLSGLSQIVSWGVTWHYNLTDGPDLSVWNMAGVDFVPLIWGSGSIPLAQADGLPEGSKALLGFNEPNFPNQANLDPETAAQLWKDVEALAEENNISTIVSPSMNWHESMDPIVWLDRFFAACQGCQVDAIGIHVFTCYAAGLKYHLDRYRVFGKPIWITEIACSDPNSPERLSAEGQMAYMMEAIPLLEADPDVARYAWFSYFKNEWEHPIVDGENGDAGLIFPNGTLTPLGKLYQNFASEVNLTEINITEPTSTTSVTATTSTSTSGTRTVTTSTASTATTSKTSTLTITKTSTMTNTETSTEITKTTTATASMTATTGSLTTTITSNTTLAEVESTSATQGATSAIMESTTATTSATTESSTESSDATTTKKEKVTTAVRSLTGTAPSTTLPEGGESTTTEEAVNEDNTTNTTEDLSCTEAFDAWCQSDPASAPFFPLRHCSDWRLHDAMCSSSGGANNAPQFAGTTELEDPGSFPALFLLLAVLGAAMAGAALASLFYRRQNQKCILCCARRNKEEEEQEDLKRAVSQKSDWQGNCLPVMCNKNGPSSKVAPEPNLPALLLPMEAVARRVASSPVAAEVDGSPIIGTLSRKGNGPDVAIGTPVGVTPASRAAALTTLTEAMARATCPDVSLDEREIAIHQAGRVLSSKAVLNLPLALRQEAEVWHSRQEERLNLAKSMEAVVDRASSLEEAAGEAHPADPLRALLSRAMIADEDAPEAMLADWARRASAFEEKLDEQRLRLERRSLPGDQSLLTAADLMELTADLTEMQTKASKELIELQDLHNPRAGEDWKTARNSLESKWMQFVEDSRAAVEETKSALAANRTAKILTSDTEREAALAEAARRQATFQEELQKQRQKLQKRTKAKSAAPTPLELGRLVEDEHLLQALEADRDAAMKECQQFIDVAEARHSCEEANQWREVLQGWQMVQEDISQIASGNQELREAMPEASVWASAAIKTKIGKAHVDHDEQLAMLAEAARCAATFDEELQKQRQQMKKRRKALQKGGAEQAMDPLDACRIIADEEVLKQLAKQQVEALDKCQAMASSGEGASEAWEQLATTWAQMEKDMAKAEKEVSEAAKVVTNEASSSLVQALELAQAEGVARDVDDESAARKAALHEAARRVAIFDEELSKQRAAMRRRQSENPCGASALGAALLDGETLKALASECAEAVAICEAAAEEASKEEAQPWQDILKVWANLQEDLAEATEEAATQAKASRAQEAAEALAVYGVASAARRAVAFEHELGLLTREGAQKPGNVDSDIRLAHRTALVQKLRTELAEGLAFCEARVAATSVEGAPEHLVECRNAWQELVDLWQGLSKDLEAAAQELATSDAEPAGPLRKLLDASVSDAERQKALAEAARCAAQFDEELQRQRQRLVRRKKVGGENVSGRMLALGDAIELQALAENQEAAKSACQEALSKAEASNDVEEAQGWKQIMDVYVTLDNELDATKKEIGATGSFSSEPAAEAGRQMVQNVIRDQKQSAVSCLKAVEQALNADRGPLEELIEVQQAPRSVKSNGGSTHRSRRVEAAAQVQIWDVLEEAQGLLESFKNKSVEKPKKDMETLKQLGDEASQQLRDLSATHTVQEEKADLPEEKAKPLKRDFGCQTVFRLGGMAWHANPAMQKLLEDLTKVTSQGGSSLEASNLDKLEVEVNEVVSHWRKEFVGKRRDASITRSRSRSQSRLMEVPSPATAPPTAPPAPPAPPTMLEADLVAQAAKKKEVEAAAKPPSLGTIKRDEVKVETETIGFQSSQFEESKPAPRVQEVRSQHVPLPPSVESAAPADSRSPEQTGVRAPSPGNLSARRVHAESRRMSNASANSDYEEDQTTSRQRRRRSSSRDGRVDSGVDNSHSWQHAPEQQAVKETQPAMPRPEAEQNELLAQLEQMKSPGSQAAGLHSEDRRDSKTLARPSSATSKRGGPGDGSLLVPPAGEAASRSASPSSAGSSPSPGHAPRRLDPLVRPRGPPLPSAGRLLLASQQDAAESAKTSPRSGV